MEALSGPLAARAREAIGAGCDLNLHCNAKLEEMGEVAGESPELSEHLTAKLAASLGEVASPGGFDREAAVGELANCFKELRGSEL